MALASSVCFFVSFTLFCIFDTALIAFRAGLMLLRLVISIGSYPVKVKLVFHRYILASLPPVANQSPLEEKAHAEVAPSCPYRVYNSLPILKSNSLIEQSYEVEMR